MPCCAHRCSQADHLISKSRCCMQCSLGYSKQTGVTHWSLACANMSKYVRKSAENMQMYMCTQTHAHALQDSNCRKTNSNFAQGKRKKGENNLQLAAFEKIEQTQPHWSLACADMSTCSTCFLKNGTNTSKQVSPIEASLVQIWANTYARKTNNIQQCTYTLLSYTCLFELISSLFLSFPHWNLSCPMPTNKIHKHMCTFLDVLICSSSLHGYLSTFWTLFRAFTNVIWAALFTYIDLIVSYTCLIHVRLSPFWTRFWAFHTGIWAVPYTKKTCINICVPLLVFFITTSVFELTLSSVLGFSQCDLSCCLYILHIPRCTLMSYMCLFELILSLILSFPHWNSSNPMHKKIYITICVPLLVFFITTSVFELTLSSVLSFFQCDLSCCLYILHIPWCTLMSYMCLFELILSLILSFPHWNLRYPIHNKTYTNIFVPLLVFFITLHRYLSSLWALSWAFSNVIWAAAFTYYIYLDAPWCPICVCLSLSSFWAWFWAFPTGIWAIPYTTRRTQTYLYLCWCSSSLHRYLSSLWALSWVFSNVIWAAAFTYYIYLDAPWCPIYVCLSSFWAWFWGFPSGFWAIPCPRNDINIRVALLVLFTSTSVFELTLSSVLSFLQCDLSCYLYILHIPWCPVRVRLSPFWAWFWAFPIGIWAIPCQRKWHKHTCSLVEVLHHYIDIRVHVELCLELFPKWFELLPLHTTYTLVSYRCSFELMLSFPHWNLSYPMHKKTYVNICVPLLVFFITTSVFELTLSSVLGFL